MAKPRRLSLNTAGMVLIASAYVYSVVSISRPPVEPDPNLEPAADRARVVQIMHWQLEPGFREALQEVIDAYHQLPHVRDAGLRVEQLAVPNRVYAQILNVHAISGTAPDLCQQGTSILTGGNVLAQYFEGLSGPASEPNPYNQPEHLPEGLHPALFEELGTRPWRDTFLNGMQSGWSVNLQDYFSVPTSFAGTTKLFVNLTLMREAKRLLRDAARQPVPPQWYSRLLLRPDDNEPRGYLAEDDAFASWLADDSPPDTLGRLLAVGHAMRQLGSGSTKIAPIAGSNYSYGIFAQKYRPPFTAAYAETLDINYTVSVDSRETWFGWQSGAWSFDDPAIRSYFDCLRELCGLFPPGFLGLDREQARRRFVAGQAGIIASGVWDAASIFRATENEFEVGVINFPLPGPGERWAQQTGWAENSASAKGGAEFMIYRRSPNRDWALDFLRYLTSYAANQRFNDRTGWIPIVVGTRSDPKVAAFRPDPHGVAGTSAMLPSGGAVGQIATRYEGELKNFLAGDQTYAQFVERIEAAASDPNNGVDRAWDRYRHQYRDWVRNADASLAVQIADDLLLETPDSDKRVRRALRRSCVMFNGKVPQWAWHRLHPDRPFPEFP
ncbi:MAG: extracellular solute-binding protein [Planctomycetota bacterium]